MEHDFYLFLSGKSNEFNVLLPRLLELYKKSWSVALIDISFTNSFFTINDGDRIEICKKTEDGKINVSTVQIFSFQKSLYSSINKVLEVINNKIEKIQFALNENGYVQLKNDEKYLVLFHGNLNKLVGFTKKLLDYSETSADLTTNGMQTNEIMDIQCNFVRPSINNEKFKSMLARIHIENNEIIFKKTINPIYIHIIKNTYSQFHFQLTTTLTSEPFPIASDATVFIKLHFKCSE